MKLHHILENGSSYIYNSFYVGLFQRAILQSGTALLPAQFGPAKKGAIAISKALNCKGEESHQLLSCFKAASVEDLVNAQSTLSVSNFIFEQNSAEITDIRLY